MYKQHKLIPAGRTIDLAEPPHLIRRVFPIDAPSVEQRLSRLEQRIAEQTEVLAALTDAVRRLSAAPPHDSKHFSEYYGKLSKHEKRLHAVDPTNSN